MSEAVVSAAALEEALEAIRLTQEYRPNPAVEGWSWFDVYKKHRPEDAKRLELEWLRTNYETYPAVEPRRDPKRYEVHVIVGASTARRSPNHVAGGLTVDLNRMQGMFGGGWTLLSVVEGPQPNSYITVWVTT